MKKQVLFILFICTTLGLSAQTYNEKAGEIQKLVWGAPPPEFLLKEVPAKYAGEGAVILAQSYTMQRTSNLKVHFFIVTAGIGNKVSRISTFHERVKINDKSALERYSTLEYQKLLDKSISLLITKITDLHETYIGAKILKPNGQEVVINTGEEVLLKNTGKDQQGKLAIPGLQVGDILDYYISNNDLSERGYDDNYLNNDKVFVLADEYPILNYSLNFQVNKKSTVLYINANGAPAFQESTLDNGDKVYNLKLKDLPKIQAQKWTSTFRQLPYIEISNQSSIKMFNNYYGNQKTGGMDANKALFESAFNEQTHPIDEEPAKMLKDYFGGKKKMRAVPLDSSMKVFYDTWKLHVFGNFIKSDLDDMSQLNYRTARSKTAVIDMSRLLTDMDIPHDILLVASREGSSLDNVFIMSDFDAIIRIANGNNPLYMSFYDAVTHFNEIPAKFQGEKAIALTPERKNARKYEFNEYQATLPVSPADKNKIEEKLNVWLMADYQHIKIQRTVKQTGFLRHSGQKELLSAMDIDAGLTELVNGDPLEKRLSKNPQTKKSADAFLAGMGKTSAQLRQDFMDEAKSQFDQEPSQLLDYKVINKGLEVNLPPFEYTSTMVLNNFVKKAGNNYILDVGKLAGSFVQLEEKDRKRAIDVYMPGARSFKYIIALNIPPGYKVTGVEDLNKQKSNKTGSFSSTAVVAGNMLNITLTRTYNNNFEKAADWPLVAELVDAAFAFNNQKILLEK
ncbi:DUF3857 domain-containing protein [Mucilaginibacter psychrotolerans]|uniref:DUF3857 domain-containing protein n=1 Tax=Mucilaginibacter psychrotolerans TaxID=1524096 RepID=A0A4Y8S6M9_9SPHI|nr:DUF3857 domain-containing protein [Mucilaginibacter psychrotolerans]TFF34679.1 DUF3857 domain-containing protein [Mucilaginibacter psychrotolerans]